MKITVITGSPHRKGTSALLADEFIRGARESGHEVFRFDAAFETLHPCLGCDRCGSTGRCVHQDSMETLIPHLKEANQDWTFKALEGHYQTIVSYLGWNSIGVLLAGGCGDRRAAQVSSYPMKAYEMGKNLV